MKYIAIILIAVLLVLLVLFISWFLNMKANGKCPICALKKVFIPTSLTIDIGEEEDYSNEKRRRWDGQAGIHSEIILIKI